jgi:hypothetical protein
MLSDMCGAFLLFAGSLYILMKALNLPDDSSFEAGAKLEL